MRRTYLIVKLAQTLARRRSALRKALAINTSLMASGDRSVGDSIDAAVECEQDELDSELATAESRELAAIDAALDRMRDGRYGTCESCGKPIPSARLQALPYATRCIQCQREEEREGFGDRGAAACHWERVTDDFSHEEANRANHLNPSELGLV